MKLFKTLILLISIFSASLFAADGQQIFKDNCVSCHSMQMGFQIKDKSTMLGPPAAAISRKIKPIFNNEEQFIEFITSYLENPSRIKARLKQNVIDRFGLMPKEIGQALSKEEKQIVAKWLYRNF